MLPLSGATIACCTRVRYCFLDPSGLILLRPRTDRVRLSGLSGSSRLKLIYQGETHRTRLNRMQVHIGHASDWFAR